MKATDRFTYTLRREYSPLRQIIVIFALPPLLCPTDVEAADIGRVCIALAPEHLDNRSAPGLFCESAKLSVEIDAQPVVAWPTKEGLHIDLDVSQTHRVVVFCDGKPQQSFKFRFAAFKARKLCLFINDLYKTVQLWESKNAPWCKYENPQGFAFTAYRPNRARRNALKNEDLRPASAH